MMDLGSNSQHDFNAQTCQNVLLVLPNGTTSANQPNPDIWGWKLNSFFLRITTKNAAAEIVDALESAGLTSLDAIHPFGYEKWKLVTHGSVYDDGYYGFELVSPAHLGTGLACWTGSPNPCPQDWGGCQQPVDSRSPWCSWLPNDGFCSDLRTLCIMRGWTWQLCQPYKETRTHSAKPLNGKYPAHLPVQTFAPTFGSMYMVTPDDAVGIILNRISGITTFDSPRYLKLNIQSFRSYGTIEFPGIFMEPLTLRRSNHGFCWPNGLLKRRKPKPNSIPNKIADWFDPCFSPQTLATPYHLSRFILMLYGNGSERQVGGEFLVF